MTQILLVVLLEMMQLLGVLLRASCCCRDVEFVVRGVMAGPVTSCLVPSVYQVRTGEVELQASASAKCQVQRRFKC